MSVTGENRRSRRGLLLGGLALVLVLVGVGVLLMTLTQENPYRGTAAESWADGEAGIKAPDNNPEFAAAYDRVREFLVLSRLDRRVVVDENPEPLLAAVAPSDRERVGEGVVRQEMATRVPRGMTLRPEAPKVDGRMEATRTGPGEVTVRTTYSFAYACDPSKIVQIAHVQAVFRVDEEGLHVQSSTTRYE